MGCVHTHQGMLTIEWWGSPSHIQSVVEKIGEDNWKAENINQIISQMFAPGTKHDKIQAWWASDILSKNMLERVCWCIHSKMESWSWTIYCSMSCSNGGKHAWVRGDRRSHAALRCCWKRNVLLLTCAKASRRKGHWSTINLTTMTKTTRAQLPK